MTMPALPDFFPGGEAESNVDPRLAQLQANAVTGKTIYEHFAANRDARFTDDEDGYRAFNMMVEYMKERNVPLFESASNALNQARQEITEGLEKMPNPVKEPAKFGATMAEGVARGFRDIYGVILESEDPTSAFFKFRSYAGRLIGKDDGDIKSQIRQFHLSREFNDATYDNNSILAEMLPEGYKDHFSKYVDQKAAIALSWFALDAPEFILSLGTSTPATAAKLAASSAAKTSRAAKAEKVWGAWANATTNRVATFGQKVMGNTLEGAGATIKAPFKAIYGTSQAAAQLAGDYAGNAVRNVATAEIVEAGAQMVAPGVVRNPAIGFLRSFGAEAMGELMEVAGQDMVDRSLGKTMVKVDSLGMTTLERLASGTAKGSEAMSREAQLMAKGVNAAIGWAPSLSGATLKTMVRDGMFGAALGWANSPQEGLGAGLAIGTAWGGLSGSIRHLHSYTQYTPQDSRVVDNFRDYVIPAFGRTMGPTSMEMARRFYDKVNGFGDLRTSSIELSHLSTLVAHEASLVGEGNVMFYFGNSPQEFSNIIAESNVKPGDYDKLVDAFNSMGTSAGMFEKITLNDGSVKRLIAINSDLYRPTTARHEITHSLFRSVVEANAEMDSVIDKATGRYMGDVFNPSYASRIFGTSKDAGVLPDAAWDALMTSYGAAKDWSDFGKPSDPAIVEKIGQMAKANYGNLLTRIRGHLKNGVDMQKYEVMDDFRTATNMAEEAFAYYAAGTSNVFPVDKYVKDPAARNLLRGLAENRAARKYSRVLSSLEEAGVEIKAKFTNPDGSPKLFDENGNPAIETFMFDDGVVIRTPGMDSWVESVLKQAYAKSEVLVSTLDPYRQEAFAKEHGKTHIFKSVPTGGMRLKSPSELDEQSKNQAAAIINAVANVQSPVGPVVQTMPDGSQRINLENATAETMQAVGAAGVLTPQEFKELSAIVKVAEKNRAGDVTFNVMTGTLLAHTKQVRRGAGVFRLTGSDVPVTYRTFMPYSVEVTLKTHDADGNPLRSPKGGILIHSIDVAAVNRRLTKTFKRPDVRALFGNNFSTFVDRFNLYVSNQSGLNGAKVPTADLFRAEFGQDAEKVRDIMYEAFGGRKRKDDAFINTPADGYMGGADDPNRPFYTMRFDTLADIKVHPTSWNVHSKVQPFPYVHVQGYDGVSRNFQITGFTERDLGNGKKYLKDNHGFEIYDTKAGYALYDPFAIKVGVFKTAKAAIKRAAAELGKIDDADKVEQLQTLVDDSAHRDPAIADLEMITEASNRAARFHLGGLHTAVVESLHEGKKAVEHINAQTADSDNTIGYQNFVGDKETAFSRKFVSLLSMLGDKSKAFDTKIEIDGREYSINMSDTQIAISDPTIGMVSGTEVVGGFGNELMRIDRQWFKEMYAADKELLQDQIARRMALAVKVNALHKAGLINLPTSFNVQTIQQYRALGNAMYAGSTGPMGARDAAMSKALENHGLGMANLAGDINWAFFSPSQLPRGGESQSSFSPSTFTKGWAGVEPRWESALSSFVVTDELARDPVFSKAIAQARSSKSKDFYSSKVGAETPMYIDVDKFASGPNGRNELVRKLLDAGARRGAFWEFHSQASGIDDILPALNDFIKGSRGKLAKLTPPGQGRERAVAAQRVMQEGPAKMMVQNYMKSVEALAKRGGMFTKSVAGFFNEEGKLRVGEDGSKKGFVSSLAMLDMSDEDVKRVASMSDLYGALAHISEDIKRDPSEANKMDYVRVLALIMRITSDSSLIFHEFKSLDDRAFTPGAGEIRARTGLMKGGESEVMDFYTLPPTIGEIVTPDAPSANVGASGSLVYAPINVNRNHPSRYERIAAERSMHFTDAGIPAMISVNDRFGIKGSVDIKDVSHIVAAGPSVRSFMADTAGTGRVTTDPSSLARTPQGIVPKGSEWNGAMPAMALQFFASKDGVRSLDAMVPTAQKAVEETLSAATGWRWTALTNDLKNMTAEDRGRGSKITMMLKQSGVIGDNMALMEQMAHGYVETFHREQDVRLAGALRIAQALSTQENLFKSGLDADSFPSQGAAHSLLRSINVKQAKITPASNAYLRNLKQFIKTGSIADTSGGYSMQYRTMPASVEPVGKTGTKVEYGAAKVDTVQSSPLMMITGAKAIAQLDKDRKNEMRKLGLIGRMSDGMGNEFDYFELSDSRAEINLSKFGGERSGIFTAGLGGSDAAIRRYVESYVDAKVNNDPNLVDVQAMDEVTRAANSHGLRMKDIISHPELFAFYQNIGDAQVRIDADLDSYAAWFPHAGIFKIGAGLLLDDYLSEAIRSKGKDNMMPFMDSYASMFSPEIRSERFRKILIHEIQHAVASAERMLPSIWPVAASTPGFVTSLLNAGSHGIAAGSRALSNAIAGGYVNAPLLFNGSDQIPVPGAAVRNTASIPALSTLSANSFEQIDQALIKRMSEIHAGNSSLIKLTKSMQGFDAIVDQDPDVIKASMDRIFEAPLAVDLMERVIPNQKLLTMKVQTKLHQAIALLASGRIEGSTKAMAHVMIMSENAEKLLSKMDAYSQLVSKYDPPSALSALKDIRRDITDFNEHATLTAEFVSPMIGEIYDRELTVLRDEVSIGLNLAAYKSLMGLNPLAHSPGQAYKIVNILTDDIRTMLYSSGIDEFIPNTTMMRSRMTEAQLAENKYPAFTPMYQNMTEYAKWVESSMTAGFQNSDGPKLKMIGGSAGSEPINVSIFGEASGNMFKAGIRMIARGALLSHYVSVLNDDLKRFGKATYNSRGWKIAADGMPVYVNEVGTLSDMKILKNFGDERTFGLATGVEQMNVVARQAGSQVMRDGNTVARQFGNFRGTELEFRERVTPLAQFIVDNQFLTAKDAYNAMGAPIAFMAGLTSDGVSVTIQDVAKALGAVVQVEDTIGYRSEVMNALYNAQQRGIPQIIKASELVDVLKNAGVPESEMHAAKIFDIKEKFKGAELSVGELVDLVAVLHDVPLLTTYEGGKGAKSLMLDIISGRGTEASFRELYDYAMKGEDTHAEVMRAYINNKFDASESGDVPLTSILKRKSSDNSSDSIRSSRFFLMDVIQSRILFEWNASKAISKMVGKADAEAVLKKIMERLQRKYPDRNKLPEEWDPLNLSNMIVNEQTDMSVPFDTSSHGAYGWQDREQKTMAAYERFASRLERLLVMLTPMAERLGDMMMRSIKNDDDLISASQRKNDRLKDLLAEFYSSALEEGLKGSFSSSALQEAGRFPYESIRDLLGRAMSRTSYYDVGGPSGTLLTRGFGYAGDAPVGGMMVMHGLMGGAQRAFADSATIRSIQAGMAGTSPYPLHVGAIEAAMLEGYTGNPIANMHRNIKFSAGDDVPTAIQLQGGARGMVTLTRGSETEMDKIDNFIGSKVIPSTMEAVLASKDRQALHITSAYQAQRALVLRAMGLLDHIDHFAGQKGLENKLSALQGASRISASSLMSLITEKPELVSAIGGPDAGPQLVKAKALLSLAEDVEQAAHNIGAGNIVAVDQGYYRMPPQIDRTGSATGYKPVSQATFVRSYRRGDAIVVGSAYEALGSTSTEIEAKVINALTKKDNSKESTILASEPVRVVARTMAVGANLFAENADVTTPLFVKASDTAALERAIQESRSTRILRAISKAADRIRGEYFDAEGNWTQDIADVKWFLSKQHTLGGFFGAMSSNYRRNGFMRHLAHAADGTSLLAATAQSIFRATDENTELAKKLDDFVRTKWLPVKWWQATDSVNDLSDAEIKTQIRMLASLRAAMLAVVPAHMRRPLLRDVNHAVGVFMNPYQILPLQTIIDSPDGIGLRPDDHVGGKIRNDAASILMSGMESVLQGLSHDSVKQIMTMAGMIFVKQELIDRLGNEFTPAEKVAIEAMMADTVHRQDLIDGFDADSLVEARSPQISSELLGRKTDQGDLTQYRTQKESLSADMFRKVLRASGDMFSERDMIDYAIPSYREMSKIPGYSTPLTRNHSENKYGANISGNVSIRSGLPGRNPNGVIRTHVSGAIRLSTDLLDQSFIEDSYRENVIYAGHNYVNSRKYTDSIHPAAGKGSRISSALATDHPLGMIGAMFEMTDPVDLIMSAPEEKPGVIDVNVGVAGRSAMSQGVIRSFLADSIIGRAQRSGAKTIEIAPAGVQLSYGGAGILEMSGTDSAGTIKGAVRKIHGRGVRTISKTNLTPLHSKEKKNPNILSHGASKLPGHRTDVIENQSGTGYLGDPHRAGEQATKKGYAWKRLPDGRIMVNITGDHLGYKLDYNMSRPGRINYGFSLAEGVGYDPNSGLLLPNSLLSQLTISDASEMLQHPFAELFKFNDPAMMQAYIDAALNDKRGYHHTRGNIEGGDHILPPSSSFSGRMDRADFKAFLVDKTKVFERRAYHAASYQDINAPSSYATFILPAGLSTEEVAAHLMALHVDPTIGFAIGESGKRDRVDRAMQIFPTSSGFDSTRFDRGVYYEKVDPKKSIMPQTNQGPYTMGSVMGLKDSVKLGVSQDPHLWNDVFTAASKILGQEGGYFLPDTERALSVNGDTGLAISMLFPGRSDLMVHSWDSKAANGIKVWKRTIPKDAVNFRAHVVELNSPTMISPEGGLVIGKRAVAFKTEAEAIAYANKVAAQASSASLVRALSGGDFRIVERPGEGGTDKFAPDMSPISVDKVITQTGRAFEDWLEPSGLYRIGDLDMALSPAEARKLGKAIGKNAHIEFDTPPVRLRQITGLGMDELEAIVRKKTNIGLPQGALNFSSKAMNAIVRGTHPSPSKKDFTHLTGTEWLKVLERGGVTKDEIRQTGLGHMLLNYGDVTLSRQDLAEFVAASYPLIQRSSPAFYGMHAAQQVAALGLPTFESVGGKDHFIPPFIHDSRLQSRANQINAVHSLSGMRYRLDAMLLEPETSDSAKQQIIPLIALIDQRMIDFAKIIGIPESEAATAGVGNIISKLQELTRYPDKAMFSSYDMRQLEIARLDFNDKIRLLSQDTSDGILFSSIGEIGTYVDSMMAPALFPADNARDMSLELLNAARNGLPKKEYGWNSPYSEMGQSLHAYGSFPYTSYISGAYQNHYQTVVRYADKAGMETMKEYLAEIKSEIGKAKHEIAQNSPNAEKLKQRIGTLEAMRETAERVMEVRLTAAAKLSQESSRHHGSHFSGSMPNGTEMVGGGGAYELGHSRFSWAMLTSALNVEGFASIMGLDSNGELQLGFRREPIALIEEIQSDVFQNVDLFGTMQDPKLFLPADATDKASFGRASELAKLVADHASLVALSQNAEEKAVSQLVSIIGRPGNSSSPATGSKLFENFAARLFLDQTDLFQRSMMHEAVPGLLRNTGRKAKVPDGIRASISRMTGGMPAPMEIFVFDFDHELIDVLRQNPVISMSSNQAVYDFVKKRLTENMHAANHADPAMAAHVNPRAAAAFRNDLAKLAGGDISEVANRQLSIVAQIITRGIDALRAQGYDALKNEVRNMEAMNLQGSQMEFVKGLYDLGSKGNEIGNVVASHVARAIVRDEQLAMQMAAFIEGTGAIDYEALVDRTIERIRKDYGDSKSYIGKAVLVILDELKKQPAETRPHMTATSGFSDVKTMDNSTIASQFDTAVNAISATDSDRMIADVGANLPNPADRANMVYVRVDGSDRGGFSMGAGTGNTFRTFTSGLDFAKYIRDVKAAGADYKSISVYVAPYHRHNGSAAGDFAKNVVEVFAAMSQGPKFLEMAKAKEAELAVLRKDVKETYATDSAGRADTIKGKKVIYPDVIPGVAEGSYKTTQLIMNVLDSMNHGSHGVGVLDATYQMQRGGGLKEPGLFIRVGGPKGYFVAGDSIGGGSSSDNAKFFGGALMAWEKDNGKNPNGPEGPHGGFLHRMANMNLGELGDISRAESIRFTHNGVEGTLFEHLIRTMDQMKDSAQKYFPTEWIRKFENNMSQINDPFRRAFSQPHAFEGKKPTFDLSGSGSRFSLDRISGKLASDTGMFVVAGVASSSGGWGYVTNYGLPMYAMELVAPGASADFRRNYALDAFERPTISVDGTRLVINDKNGRAVEVIDQATATPKQLESFRERYLQMSAYKGGNWMVKTFLKEFGPAGGYVDFGVVGPTATFTSQKFGQFPYSLFADGSRTNIENAIRAKYIETGLTPVHLGEDTPFELAPTFNNIGANVRNQENINQAMIDRGMMSMEAGIDMSKPARVATSYLSVLAGQTGSIPNEINPQGAMAQPLTYGAKYNGGFHAGLNDETHVRGLVAMYFPRAKLDTAAAASYVMRMTNPLNTIMVHTPLKRTKEMEIQFRRRVMEGIPLMQITGADAPGGEPISTNGVKRLAHMLKQREMLPKIKDNDERN